MLVPDTSDLFIFHVCFPLCSLRFTAQFGEQEELQIPAESQGCGVTGVMEPWVDSALDLSVVTGCSWRVGRRKRMSGTLCLGAS